MDESRATDRLQGDTPFAPAQTPRLSILHLMLWTLCSAVHLTLYRAINDLQRNRPADPSGILDASKVISAIVFGAVLTGSIVLVHTRVRSGPPMLRQPGHWLLFIRAVQSLLYTLLMVGMLFLQWEAIWPSWGMLLSATFMTASTVGYGLAVWHQRNLRWRLLFLLLAVLSMAHAVPFLALAVGQASGSFGGMSSWALSLLSMRRWAGMSLVGAIVAVSIGELFVGLRRDWLHWTGIATAVAGTLVSLMWMVAGWLSS